MPALAAVVLRPATVVAVFGGLLWMSGFFNAAELATLARVRRPVSARTTPPMPSPDSTELAGEIIRPTSRMTGSRRSRQSIRGARR